MMNNAVIKKRSLADEVASALQEQIAKGVYKIGDKLPIEPELMKQYGASTRFQFGWLAAKDAPSRLRKR